MRRIPIEIGICAYNEEANIKQLIESILQQKQETYSIKQVLLISDGSSDSTVRIAKKLNDHRLKIIDHADRAGKPARENEIFRAAKCLVLVMLDADIILNSTDTLSALVQPIINGEATLASGHPIKTKVSSFNDRVMDVSLYLQDQIKLRFKSGESVYACHGRILALHRDIYSSLSIMPSAVGDDAYIYFYNKQRGNNFKYVEKAEVLFKMPQSLSDFISQQRRFSSSPKELAKIFGENTLLDYHIPIILSLKIMMMALFKYHIYAFGYLYYRVMSKMSHFSTNAKWTISESTKKL